MPMGLVIVVRKRQQDGSLRELLNFLDLPTFEVHKRRSRRAQRAEA
jgi:hypothetical protein